MNQNGIGWRSKGGQSVTIVGSDISDSVWLRIARIYQLRIDLKGGVTHKFDGFNESDYTKLKEFLQKNYNVELKTENLSLKGWNWGSVDVKGSSLLFKVDNLPSFEAPLNEVSSATVNKQEVTVEFHHDEIGFEGSDSIVELRFYVPNEDDDIDDSNAAQILTEKILAKADVLPASGKGLINFGDMHILTPRGRYDIELFPSFFKMMGKSNVYKIKYSSIVRMFRLPKPDGKSIFFVLSLEPAIRQGHTSYPHVVMQLSTQEVVEDLDLNIPDDLADDKRISALNLIPKNSQLDEVMCSVFRQLVNKKIISPKGFSGHGNKSAIKCSLKAIEGFLFPLERSFFFVHKPPTHILFEEITSVKFERVSSESNTSGNRTFDIYVNLTNGSTVTFTSIQRSEYSPLYNFLVSKGLTISNFEDDGSVQEDISEEEEEEVSEDKEEDDEEHISRRRKKRKAAEDARRSVRNELKIMKVEEDEESDEEFVENEEGSESEEDGESDISDEKIE